MTDFSNVVGDGSDLPFDPYDDPRPGAKTKMIGPGIGLLITGIICIGFAFYGALASGHAKGQLQQASRQIQKTEGMPPEQKKFWKDFFATYEKFLPVMNGLNAVFGAIVAIGGFQLLTLSGRMFCYFACILSMIPFATGCCCCAGVIFGAWGIFMLNMPDVRAGFAMTKYLADRKS
jgi:hypothetical protein